METGTDGRFYDSHYDFDHDGFLDCGEQLLYEEDVFGHELGSYTGRSYRRKYSRTGKTAGIGAYFGALFLWLLVMGLFVFGVIVAVLCPPAGALLIYFGYAIRDKIS
ncbi:MAG: hypothetical protein K6F86_06345 [Lachnospiraceae bacterium]|nr:hypothetical protein [Lachnospiraceae bacterium]